MGSRVARFDIPNKVKGTYMYVQHVHAPGMRHGRVVWPHGPGANGISLPTVVNIDESSVSDIPNVRIVRRRNLTPRA